MTTPNSRDELALIVQRALTAEADPPARFVDQYGAQVVGVKSGTLAVLDAILAAGWRPPLPKADLRMMRSLLAGIIDRHFGDDYREQAGAAADEIISRGWLDKVGEVGPPEPVATTLRRIIRDLEEQAAGPQRHTHAGIALNQYADRLRGHPALDADADAGWLPLPGTETEWGYRRATDPEFYVRKCAEESARSVVADPEGENWVLVSRRKAGPWVEVRAEAEARQHDNEPAEVIAADLPHGTDPATLPKFLGRRYRSMADEAVVGADESAAYTEHWGGDRG